VNRWRGALFPLALCLAQCARDPTGVFVTVNVENGLMVNAVVARTFDADNTGGNPLAEGAFSVEPGQTSTFYVGATPVRRQKVRIEVYGFYLTNTGNLQLLELPSRVRTGDMGLVSDRAIVTYVDDQVVKVSLALRGVCRMTLGRSRCPVNQHCDAGGGCVSAEVDNPPRYQW